MNDYYVYFHIGKTTNTVFYVGKGNNRSKRAYRKERSKDWDYRVADEGGYSIKIVSENLTESQALSIESDFINNPDLSWKLVNKQKSSKVKIIPDFMSDYVYYDESSKSCLKWKQPIGRKIKVGTDVGSLGRDGYWSFELRGVSYLSHRVVLALAGRLDNSRIVNHINNKRCDNRMCNLEMVSFTENNRKSIHHNTGTVRSNNTSGVNGVLEKVELSKYKYACVEWYDMSGVKRCRRFSYLKHGKDLAWELAISFRNQTIKDIQNATKP